MLAIVSFTGNIQRVVSTYTVYNTDMSRRLLILFAILVIFSAAATSGRRGCPKNEVWDSCGTACPPTCKKPKPDICTLQCNIGCRCVKGLLRNEKEECVPPSECP